jgi:hypothetical protein
MVTSLSALQNVKTIVNAYGDYVSLLKIPESNLDRDNFNNISYSNSNIEIKIKSFPIRFSPTQKILESTGIREQVDAIFYFSSTDFEEAISKVGEIDVIRWKLIYDNISYNIKEKNYYSQFGNKFLYVVLGVNKA